MLDQCVSLGGGLRLPTSALALAARRSLKRPRLLLLGHPAALFASSGSQPQQHQHQHQQRENPRAAFPVAIVGAGPAGLTLSALLSKFGVPSILLERAPGLPTHPQAHFINLRSMEILRHAFGGLDSRVLEICPPQEEWRDFVVCSTVLGRQLARVDNFHGGVAERQALSPTGVAHLSQNVLLPLLLEEAQRAAAQSCPSTQILFDAGVAGLRRLNNGGGTSDKYFPDPQLEVSIQKRRSPGSSPATRPASTSDNDVSDANILCKYVVAADGAGSSVREAAGIGLSGRRQLGSLVNIHFRCKGLRRLLLRDRSLQGNKRGQQRPGMLYFVYNEETICVLVAHNVQKGEWACQVPFFPPHETAEFFTSDRSEAIIRQALGPGSSCLDLEICSIRPWTMNALVADRYFGDISAKGRKAVGVERRGMVGEGGVILVGDAAHQFPPAGGFGLNTGLQDAHNLAWKLASVHHGLASPELLLTYEEERRPVAMRNAALSVRNLKRSLRVLETLGVDPKLGASADLMDQLVRSPLTLNWSGGLGAMAASLLGVKSFEENSQERSQKILRLGRRQLESLREEGHPFGESRVRALRQLLAEGGGLPLLFPEHDVGFLYSGKGSAVFASASVTPPNPPRRTAGAAGVEALARSSDPDKHPSGGRTQAQQDGGDDACFPPSPPASSTLRLGGRMPHFVLTPLTASGESRGHAAIGESSLPGISTVDLPDQVRALLLARFGAALGPSTPAAAVDGRASRARASLASVLVVSPAPTVAFGVHSSASGGGSRPSDGDAEAVSARWLRIAVAAQEQEGGDGRSAAAGTDRCVPRCPLVVLTIFPHPPPGALAVTPTATATTTTTINNSNSNNDDVGDTDDETTLATTMTTTMTTTTMPSVEHLETYFDRCNTAQCTSSVEAVVQAAERPRQSTNERLDFVGFGESPDANGAVQGQVLSMRAVDDTAGHLANAFAAAGTDAVLLRPDGHIAWLGQQLRLSRSSCDATGACSDPAVVRELRRALDAVYPARQTVMKSGKRWT